MTSRMMRNQDVSDSGMSVKDMACLLKTSSAKCRKCRELDCNWQRLSLSVTPLTIAFAAAVHAASQFSMSVGVIAYYFVLLFTATASKFCPSWGTSRISWPPPRGHPCCTLSGQIRRHTVLVVPPS